MPSAKVISLSKKALGTFTLGALMSVLMIKFFCQLALAADERPEAPKLNGGAQILGLYKVTRAENHPEMMNRKLWVARSEKSVALISADGNTKTLSSEFPWPELHYSCSRTIGAKSASSDLFKSHFCRGLFKEFTDDKEVFAIAKETNPAVSLIFVAVVPLIGQASTDTVSIELPKGETVPQEISVIRRKGSVNLLLPMISSFSSEHFKLERIGD